MIGPSRRLGENNERASRSTRATWTSSPCPPSAVASTQTEKATLATLGDTDHPNFAREMTLLAEMLSIADRARHQPDEKLKKLFEYIDRNMVDPGSHTRWNEHRIIVFTEYDDTLAYIRR